VYEEPQCIALHGTYNAVKMAMGRAMSIHSSFYKDSLKMPTDPFYF